MPFGGTEPREIVKKIRAGQYKPLREAAPHVPEPVAALVSRMLASKPEDRPQTGQEIVATLTEISRTYGFETSNTSLATLIANLFQGETSQQEITIAPPRTEDVSATKKLATGSNQTATQADPDSNKAFGAAGSNSASFNRATPTGGAAVVDVSVSIARRSHTFDTPIPGKQPTQPVPLISPELMKAPDQPGANARMIRIMLIAVMVIAVAVAMYIFIKPQ
jgi:hypothetical protein